MFSLRLVILFSLASSNSAKIHFTTYDDAERTTQPQTSVICSYDDSTTGKYFDIYRNGRPCITAAFGACAEVLNRGCQCAEEMEINEVRFTVDSTPDGYDILKCRVLNGISKEKTINVTSAKSDEKDLQNLPTAERVKQQQSEIGRNNNREVQEKKRKDGDQLGPGAITVILIAIATICAAIGFGYYFYYNMKKKKDYVCEKDQKPQHNNSLQHLPPKQ